MQIIREYKFVGHELNQRTYCGAELLDVQVKDGEICAWFLVDTSNKRTDRKLRIYATNERLPMSHGKHVATVQENGFVYHVFDMGG